jgi:hypothetical protein
MRNRKLIMLVCALLYFTHVKSQQENSTYYPSVLIELFSSEGCSSCPIADDFLKELIAIADSTQSPVFCLDYHVDIWNRSGWVDKFSDSLFTQRQATYMKKTKQEALFTPMIFVNGTGALPGGAKKEVAKLINYHMKSPVKASLSTKAGYVRQSNSIVLDYNVKGAIDSCNIVTVLAYKQVSSNITSGENAGKTLIHMHTAIKMQQAPIPIGGKGTLGIELPANVPVNDLMLISFVQHQGTWHVLATDELMFRQ